MSIWQGVEGFRGREGGRQERCPGYLAAGQSADQIAACLDYARASIRS
jgi:hypothetical protein